MNSWIKPLSGHEYTGAGNQWRSGKIPYDEVDITSLIHDYFYEFATKFGENPYTGGPISRAADSLQYHMLKGYKHPLAKAARAAWYLKHKLRRGQLRRNRAIERSFATWLVVQTKTRKDVMLPLLYMSGKGDPQKDLDDHMKFPFSWHDILTGEKALFNKYLEALGMKEEYYGNPLPPAANPLPPNNPPAPDPGEPTDEGSGVGVKRPPPPPGGDSGEKRPKTSHPRYGHRSHFRIISEMPRYRRRRIRKRTFRKNKRKYSRSQALINHLRKTRPIGIVKDQQAGQFASSIGQQNWATLPLSMTPYEIKKYAICIGEGNTPIADNVVDEKYVYQLGTTVLPHDPPYGTFAGQTGAVTGGSGAADTIPSDQTRYMNQTKLTEYLYNFGTTRQFVFKNHMNVNIELVVYEIMAKRMIYYSDTDITGSAGDDDRDIPQVMMNSTATKLDGYATGNPPGGGNARAADIATIDQTLAITDEKTNALDEKAQDNEDNKKMELDDGNIGHVNTSYDIQLRIGYTPERNSTWRKAFKVLRRKKYTVPSNYVWNYNYHTKNVRKIDVEKYYSSSTFNNGVACSKGQRFLMLCIRGFPTVAKIPAADNGTFEAEHDAAWFDGNVTSNADSRFGAVTNHGTNVTTSEAGLIWTENITTKFMSDSKVRSTRRAIEHHFMSGPSLTTYEIDEDGTTAHATTGVFSALQ